MNSAFRVQVVRRGVITLPRQVRVANNIQEGDTLTLIDLGGGVFVLSPFRSQVDEVANRLARQWQEAGESLESMLKTLREVRDEYDAQGS